MSKLNKEVLQKAIDGMYEFASGSDVTVQGEVKKGKKRNFVESVEMQVTLKNYDAQRDKRFSGTFRLPVIPKSKYEICVLGNAKHCEKAEQIGVDKMNVDDLKKFNKNKKVTHIHTSTSTSSTQASNALVRHEGVVVTRRAEQQARPDHLREGARLPPCLQSCLHSLSLLPSV